MTDKCIGIYKNVFKDDFCNQLINVFEESVKLGFTKNRNQREGAEETFKNDESVFITEMSSAMFTQELADIFYQTFQECLNNYTTKYSSLKQHPDPLYVRSIKIQKTKPGQGYHVWHFEHDKMERNRVLAWTAYINDDFEAGETEFLYQQYRYKPNKGDVVIFPAGFTHTHRGNPPIGGDKYIITGWVEF
jgi:hypothetical protein